MFRFDNCCCPCSARNLNGDFIDPFTGRVKPEDPPFWPPIATIATRAIVSINLTTIDVDDSYLEPYFGILYETATRSLFEAIAVEVNGTHELILGQQGMTLGDEWTHAQVAQQFRAGIYAPPPTEDPLNYSESWTLRHRSGYPHGAAGAHYFFKEWTAPRNPAVTTLSNWVTSTTGVQPNTSFGGVPVKITRQLTMGGPYWVRVSLTPVVYHPSPQFSAWGAELTVQVIPVVTWTTTAHSLEDDALLMREHFAGRWPIVQVYQKIRCDGVQYQPEGVGRLDSYLTTIFDWGSTGDVVQVWPAAPPCRCSNLLRHQSGCNRSNRGTIVTNTPTVGAPAGVTPFFASLYVPPYLNHVLYVPLTTPDYNPCP